MMTKSKPEALYVHVPFCASICSYCDFARELYREERAQAWLEAIKADFHAYCGSLSFKTVYIGGGTPTALKASQLAQLLDLLAPCTQEALEYTVEVNPETLDQEKCRILVDHGVNRCSLGYQTSDAKLLKLIHRRHTSLQVEQCVRMLKMSGIENLSLDLMYSLPSQTMESLMDSVEQALAMNPTHLSLYSLTIEENSIFGKKGMSSLDEDTEADMYEWIVSRLEAEGFEHYEISNFARPGYQSMHNRMYWTYRDFVGIGCGASGKEGLVRYDRPRHLSAYLQDPLKKEEIPLSLHDAEFEMLMMNLRLQEGMSMQLFRDTFHESFDDVFAHAKEKCIWQGLLEEKNGFLKASPHGFEILNTVLEEFL